MKILKRYKNKPVLIKVNSKEEFEFLVPFLNKVWIGWKEDNYFLYFKESKKDWFYIDCKDDCVVLQEDLEKNTEYDKHIIYEAKEFFPLSLIKNPLLEEIYKLLDLDY